MTLNYGDILTGTGGAETHVTIAASAAVTLSGVDITSIPNDGNHQWAGITCEGNAFIMLADGTNNIIKGGFRSAGIFVPKGYMLNIGGGEGSLTAIGGDKGAGIGCNYSTACGDISITDGNITAIGGDYHAGIGGGGDCGDIKILGGTVTAKGGSRAAGIGCGEASSHCGRISIVVCFSVTATAGEGAHAIGLGVNKDLTSVKSVTIRGTEVTNVPQSSFVYNPTDTNTSYTVHFDKNNANVTGTMDDQVFTSNMAQALTPCSFSYDAYHYFAGWNTKANGKGYSFNDEQGIINLGDVTLYAQWKCIDYPITYVNAEDGTDCVTNTNPKIYTVESNDITLAEPVRVGFTFDGWTYEGQDEPTKTVTIPQSSHGARTFTAHWTLSPTATITPTTRDAYIYDGQTLTGTGGDKTHVTIADGATVTLSGATITSIPNKMSYKWAGITCEGDATIILSGDNDVKGGYENYPGIFVPEGNTLTISGSGFLNASSNGEACGIGGGYKINCGNIFILGGTVNATGSDKSAAIGSGYKSSCGDIIITKGVTSVTATIDKYATYSIGAGNDGTCGTVLIGGVTGAITESPYTYAPTSSSSTVHFDANGGTKEMDDWHFTYDGTWHSLPAVTLAAPAGSFFAGWNTKADGSGTSYRDQQQVLDIADMTLYAQWALYTYALTKETGALRIVNGQTLTGTGGKQTHVTIADGATVTLNSVNIVNIQHDVNHKWAGITCDGDATIILNGENAVTGGNSFPGILVPEGKTLTITGTGTITATGRLQGAGIGGGKESSCGNIIISGGTITATGESGAAGIGGGYEQSCGDITISGGIVNAIGGSCAPGIGSGRGGSCGDITITDGITRVTATKTDDAVYSDIIGKGNFTSSGHATCGTITISSALIDETRTIITGYDEDFETDTYNFIRTLWPGTVLADDADNSTAISSKNGLTTDVQLRGRTLYKDDAWNTICLPFEVDLAAAGCPLADATARELTEASISGTTLNLTFGHAVTALQAGKPYIIKWASGTNLTENDLVFNGVTISSADNSYDTSTASPAVITDERVRFLGTHAAKTFESEDKSILFLGAENTLYYPQPGGNKKPAIGAQRAYFMIGQRGQQTRMLTAFNINFGDGQTGIEEITLLPPGESQSPRCRRDPWYDMSGRKLSQKPTLPGIYMNNGKKVVIKK